MASASPVEVLASGLNVPDDLLYVPDDGTVLVGEHGDGHIAVVGGPVAVTKLAQVIPEAEGIAQMGGVTYVADQLHARVVALTATGVRTVIQLQPVPSGENLDGIGASGDLLWIPDSPHGTLLAVDKSGRVVRRETGFSRPAGIWTNPTGHGGPYLVADENAAAVFALQNAGGHYVLAGNLPGVDDVVRTNGGHVLVILPGQGRLYDVTGRANLATGLRNPQGLGFDGVENVLVTESDSGRLDRVVRTFALESPTAVQRLAPDQTVCLGILRAPGRPSTPTTTPLPRSWIGRRCGRCAASCRSVSPQSRYAARPGSRWRSSLTGISGVRGRVFKDVGKCRTPRATTSRHRRHRSTR